MDRVRDSKEHRKNKDFRLVDCRYFLNAGANNTKATLEAALERAKMLKIKKILVASCSGKTAFMALDLFGKGFSLIIVTHVTGFKKPDYHRKHQSPDQPGQNPAFEDIQNKGLRRCSVESVLLLNDEGIVDGKREFKQLGGEKKYARKHQSG